MGRAALCMRAAALLAAAGMFIFLAEGISADNDIAEAVTARVLKPTQAIAEVPEEYNELFEIQWGVREFVSPQSTACYYGMHAEYDMGL